MTLAPKLAACTMANAMVCTSPALRRLTGSGSEKASYGLNANEDCRIEMSFTSGAMPVNASGGAREPGPPERERFPRRQIPGSGPETATGSASGGSGASVCSAAGASPADEGGCEMTSARRRRVPGAGRGRGFRGGGAELLPAIRRYQRGDPGSVGVAVTEAVAV